MARLPKSPELSHTVQQLRTRLVEIRLAVSQGHLGTIETEFEQLREPVMQTGFSALEAEFWLELGQYHRSMNSVENAVRAYRRGIFAAIRSGHFRVSAEMRLWEIYAAYYRL